MWSFIITLVCLFGITYSILPPDSSDERKFNYLEGTAVNYRLPRHLLPIRYHIVLEPRLEPNLNPATFTGSTTIELNAIETSNNITLHARELNITENNIFIHDFNGNQIKIVNTTKNETRDFFIINVDKPLIKNRLYNVTIKDFVGLLNLQNAGFYLAKYHDEEGNERRFATTQFQSLGARRAFPCFDEPHMKATFKIGLIRNETQISISNEDIISTKNLGNGRFQDSYRETVKMSTYLVAFVVSEYKATKRINGQRVFGKPTAIDDGQGDYALHTGIKVLAAMEEFLNVNYSLNKMDQIGIPDGYFAPGAMENWGLVTYRESYLVYPSEKALTKELHTTLTIVAHEFAHQWFGNLVTCSWWKYIWLNEGFANYFQHQISALIEPSWRLEDEYVLVSVQSSFKSDSTLATKPMNYEQSYPGAGPPTWVAYQKAGSVIRMFEHFLTHKIFKKALTTYLLHNAYKAAEPSDLYHALQQTLDNENSGYLLGNLTVLQIMTTWDSQAGYPIVNVTRDYTTGYITLTQKRFFSEHVNITDNSTWYIPINYQFQSDRNKEDETTAEFWMTKKTEQINRNFLTSGWIIINKQQTGYYRVNYDRLNWKLIINFLNKDNFREVHVLNRAQLIDDSFTFAQLGLLDFSIPLSLSNYLQRETDYVPITPFLTQYMPHLSLHLSQTAEFKLFKEYINKVLTAAYSYLGFNENENDVYMDKLNRINVLKWLCDLGNSDCRQKSLDMFRSLRYDNSLSIAPNLEGTVYCGAMRNGNQDDWNFLYQKYETGLNSRQKQLILNGLACSETESILQGFLHKALEKNSSLQQSDRLPVVQSIIQNGKVGLNVTFKYVENNFKIVNQTFSINRIFNLFGSRFTTEEQLNELINLAKMYNVLEKAEAGIKYARNNIGWNKFYIPSVAKWLREDANNDI